MGWENWVYVNSPDAVRDIFDRQSALTSGRVPMPVVSDLLSGGNRFLFETYNLKWRKLRAVVHKLLTPKMSDTYKPSQEFEAKQLIHDITTNDDETSFYMHVRRYTTSVVMTSTYGFRVPVWVSPWEPSCPLHAAAAQSSNRSRSGATGLRGCPRDIRDHERLH